MEVLKFYKKDNFKYGLILGALVPFLSLLIYYRLKFYPNTVREFFYYIAHDRAQMTAISIPCLVLNIALFTVYINTHRDRTAKGIFAVTLGYAVLALAVKYLA